MITEILQEKPKEEAPFKKSDDLVAEKEFYSSRYERRFCIKLCFSKKIGKCLIISNFVVS